MLFALTKNISHIKISGTFIVIPRLYFLKNLILSYNFDFRLVLLQYFVQFPGLRLIHRICNRRLTIHQNPKIIHKASCRGNTFNVVILFAQHLTSLSLGLSYLCVAVTASLCQLTGARKQKKTTAIFYFHLFTEYSMMYMYNVANAVSMLLA